MVITDQKRALQGSESRDVFKQLHKEKLPDNCYALDIDFTLVEKNQVGYNEDYPHITSVLDFKLPSDGLTFAEVLAYNRFLHHDIPVHIVEAASSDFPGLAPREHRLSIHEYDGGDWRPRPVDYNLTTVEENVTWREYRQWEDRFRRRRRKEVRPDD